MFAANNSNLFGSSGSEDINAQGSGTQNATGMIGEAQLVGGNFHQSTVWLGAKAALQSQQSKWYYVSSIMTGTMDDMDSPLDEFEGAAQPPDCSKDQTGQNCKLRFAQDNCRRPVQAK
jgi:hypothetical protein